MPDNNFSTTKPRNHASLKLSHRQTKGRKAWLLGHALEMVAVVFLFFKGYRILGMNLRTPFGEVDILARKKDTLVAVEVKLRDGEMAAHNSIHPEQKKRIIAAAQCLAAKIRPAPSTIRLDAILFSGVFSWPKHIIDAF